MVAEGQTVAVEWTLAGTHRGRLLGIPATGKPICFTGVSLIRFQAGLAVADTRIWDVAGLLRQIGLLPSPVARTLIRTRRRRPRSAAAALFCNEPDSGWYNQVCIMDVERTQPEG